MPSVIRLIRSISTLAMGLSFLALSIDCTQTAPAPTGIPVADVSLKASTTLFAGDTEQLTPAVTPTNATNQNVTWTSSDTATATVSASGLVSAVGAGTTTITVTTVDGNKTASCLVTVTIPVTGVSLKASTSLFVGGTEQLTATIIPANATNQNVTWTSSDTATATVSGSGLVSAVAVGTSTITVTTEDGSKTATCFVTVAIPVAGISLKARTTLFAGDAEQLVPAITPANATNQSVTWASSDPTKVTVNAVGLVTVLAPGSVTITATTVDGNFTATCTVRVPGKMALLAGTLDGGWGFVDGTGRVARFASPVGVATDGAGNVYVADADNYAVRKITPAGVVTTLAGSPSNTGSADGTGSDAQFSTPCGVAVDGSGNVYVADTYNFTIRKITPAGVVTTLAGSPGISGSDDGTGSAARFYEPIGVAVDGSGNVYVADRRDHTIRKITPTGVVTTLAGSAGVSGTTDDTGGLARFKNPTGVAVDGSGNLYVTDQANHTIRKITPGGVVTTLAGSAGISGSTDGTGSDARFKAPGGLVVDGAGNVYVVDTQNHTVRAITPDGVVTTLAGLAETPGSADGTGSDARFYYPDGVAVDGSGNVYVADTCNHILRKITPSGVVTTIAGSAGVRGSTDGAARDARFYYPYDLALDGAGNLYVADTYNSTLRKFSSTGMVTTIVGTTGYGLTAPGPLPASLDSPIGIAITPEGDLIATAGDVVLWITTTP